MNDDDRALVEAAHREAVERLRNQPSPQVELPEVHYTELPEAKPGDVFYHEWNTYRREIARLLAEGHEGRYVLIKGETIVGLYDSWGVARRAGLERYLLQPFFVHPIRSAEPYLRIRGINLPCRS